jgi:hypothetical protein
MRFNTPIEAKEQKKGVGKWNWDWKSHVDKKRALNTPNG